MRFARRSCYSALLDLATFSFAACDTVKHGGGSRV